MWKKLLIFILLSLSFGIAAKAENTIVDVIINDKYVNFNSVYAHIKNNKTYIPVRTTSDILNKSVEWDSKTNSVTIDKNLKFTNNSGTYILNDNIHYLNGRCFIENGVFFVPARDFFNVMGISFSWDSDYYSIIINNKNINLDPSKTKYEYENDHIYWLSRIINAESQAEPFTGKIAVGNVVLNRVKSKDFPNTIYTVIFDKKHGVQYEPVINNTIYNKPTEESIKAAKVSLNGFNIAGDSLYFFNPKTATNSWIKENRTYFKSIGNHDFYI